jgi:branched-chain amino acid transport system substrate-binding protein
VLAQLRALTYDTYMLAKSTGGAMVKAGGDSWLPHRRLRVRQSSSGRYHGLRAEFRRQGAWFIGVSVSRHVRLLVVPGAGAVEPRQGAGLCNAGADTVNSIKQAREFGVNQT